MPTIQEIKDQINADIRSKTAPGSVTRANVADNLDAVLDYTAAPQLPILTTAPITDSTKAGQRFVFQGNEWQYLTQDLIDSIGDSSLPVGFPLQLTGVFVLSSQKPTVYSGANGRYLHSVFPYARIRALINFTGLTNQFVINPTLGFTYETGDLIDLSSFSEVRVFSLSFNLVTQTNQVTKIINANLLTELENQGTANAFTFTGGVIDAQGLNDLFTQLPATVKTATLDVRNNTGSATCDPTIATAKGYTVITS
jgi:hypothetical protein